MLQGPLAAGFFSGEMREDMLKVLTGTHIPVHSLPDPPDLKVAGDVLEFLASDGMTTTREVRSVTKLLARARFLALSRTTVFPCSLPFFMCCFTFR